MMASPIFCMHSLRQRHPWLLTSRVSLLTEEELTTSSWGSSSASECGGKSRSGRERDRSKPPSPYLIGSAAVVTAGLDGDRKRGRE